MNPKLLPHLETFAKAAELGSFSAAARVLGFTQAAVSQRIQTLESELKVPLFRRQGGHAFLTDAGHRLVPLAQKIVALHAKAREAVTGKEEAIPMELSLAASSIPGEHLLPALLAVFRQKHPLIQFRVAINDTQSVLNDVERGKVNLGLTGGRKASDHLEFRAFARDEMVVIVPPGDPWAKRRFILLEQFCKKPVILREAGSGSRWCLEQGLTSAGKSLSDLNIALELGSNEAIRQAVLQGMGAGVLSIHALQEGSAKGKLHTLRIRDLVLERDIFLVWDRRRALPIAAQLLLDFLQARSPELRP